MKLKNNNFWRIIEPILLGSIVNIIINAIFNPSDPALWWSKTEFVVAILFCTPITEINRFIEKKLTKKLRVITSYKFFLYQLLILSFSMLLILNIFGRIYHWLISDEFYKWDEIFVINLIVFLISFLLVAFKWAIRFYKQLKITKGNLDKSNREVNKLSSKLNHSDQTVVLKKRQGDYNVKVNTIRIALIEYGSVKVFDCENVFYSYKGSLSELAELLPENLFYQVARNIIVHREVIKSISSLSYGKILIEINHYGSNIDEATVSRPKASSFRKWYHIT